MNSSSLPDVCGSESPGKSSLVSKESRTRALGRSTVASSSSLLLSLLLPLSSPPIPFSPSLSFPLFLSSLSPLFFFSLWFPCCFISGTVTLLVFTWKERFLLTHVFRAENQTKTNKKNLKIPSFHASFSPLSPSLLSLSLPLSLSSSLSSQSLPPSLLSLSLPLLSLWDTNTNSFYRLPNKSIPNHTLINNYRRNIEQDSVILTRFKSENNLSVQNPNADRDLSEQALKDMTWISSANWTKEPSKFLVFETRLQYLFLFQQGIIAIHQSALVALARCRTDSTGNHHRFFHVSFLLWPLEE